MTVHEVMSAGVGHCQRSTNLADAAMIMWRHDCGAVPVVDTDRRVTGVITDRDICMAVATRHRRPEELSVGLVVNGPVHTVKEDGDIDVALQIMKQHQLRRLPVTDEQGFLRGMLSLSDLVLHASTGRRTMNGLDARDVFETLRHIVRPHASEHAAAS